MIQRTELFCVFEEFINKATFFSRMSCIENEYLKSSLLCGDLAVTEELSSHNYLNE